MMLSEMKRISLRETKIFAYPSLHRGHMAFLNALLSINKGQVPKNDQAGNKVFFYEKKVM